MNILIVANHFAVCSARYAADAFARLGHNVAHTGRPMGRNIWGIQVPAEYEWNETPENERNFIPDVVIVMDSAPEMLDLYAYKLSQFEGCPMVVWGVDNHVRDYRRPYFDHYFLAHKSVSVMPWDHFTGEFEPDGIRQINRPIFHSHTDMTWLPCAYDPVTFPPSPIPFAEREYDVCMIGVMYPKRWELVNAMRAAGLKVLAGTGLVYDAYRDAHHNSRVALVSSFNGDLPIRLFEGAGMGCAVLCDEIKDLTLLSESMFDVPLMPYKDVEDAVKRAQYMLQHRQFGEDMAAKAVKWTAAHTWDVRAQVVIDWLEARS